MDDEGMRIYCFADGSENQHLRTAHVTACDGEGLTRTFDLDLVQVCTPGQFQNVSESETFDNKIREVEFSVTNRWTKNTAKVRFGLSEKCGGYFCIHKERLFILKTPAGEPAIWATVDGVPARLDFISRDDEPMLRVHTETTPAAPGLGFPGVQPRLARHKAKASLRISKNTRRSRLKEAQRMWERVAKQEAAAFRREARSKKKAASK